MKINNINDDEESPGKLKANDTNIKKTNTQLST